MVLGLGCPRATTFANIFMCFHERIWLRSCPDNFKPVFYQRYIDDTFLLFRHKQHATLFLNYLNDKHPNIKFTIEHEQDNKLSFLDVLVTRSDNNFITSVYRKPTFTGLGMSFFSFCSFNFKLNSVKTLLHRAYNISSTYFNFDTEIKFLLDFFISNGFTSGLIYYLTKQFLNRKYSNNTISTCQPYTYYTSFPFFGHYSEKMKIELTELLKKHIPGCSFKIVLSNRHTIGSYFKYKDTLPLMSRSSVIYKYVCSVCGAQYIGSSTRTLNIRSAEHKGVSYRTGQALNAPAPFFHQTAL